MASRRAFLKSRAHRFFQPWGPLFATYTYEPKAMRYYNFNEGGRILWGFIAWDMARRKIAGIGIGGGIPWFGHVEDRSSWEPRMVRRWIGGCKVWDWSAKP